MMMVNAVFVESPLATAECFLRSAGCLVIFILMLVASAACWNKKCCRLACSFFCESVLLFAAGTTCAVPFAAPCIIYRNFSPYNDEWTIEPLFTVVGKVDARRICAFSFGGGASAVNVFGWADDKAGEWICQDSWGHKNSMFFPRPLLSYIDSLQFDDDSADMADSETHESV
jgi:hypothetical protein